MSATSLLRNSLFSVPQNTKSATMTTILITNCVDGYRGARDENRWSRLYWGGVGWWEYRSGVRDSNPGLSDLFPPRLQCAATAAAKYLAFVAESRYFVFHHEAILSN